MKYFIPFLLLLSCSGSNDELNSSNLSIEQNAAVIKAPEINYEDIIKIRSEESLEEYATDLGFIKISSDEALKNDISSDLVFVWSPTIIKNDTLSTCYIYTTGFANTYIRFSDEDIVSSRKNGNSWFDAVKNSIQKNLEFIKKQGNPFNDVKNNIYKLDSITEIWFTDEGASEMNITLKIQSDIYR